MIVSTSKASRLDRELQVTSAIAEVIDSPRALCVHLLAQAKEWMQIAKLDIDPFNYQVAGDFADDYLVTSLMSKSAVLPLDLDLEAEAISKFYDAENHCRETNERLDRTDFVDLPPWWRKAEREIDRMLGDLDEAALGEILERCKHGPGATVGVKGDGCVSSDKFDHTVTCTERVAPFAAALMGETWFDYRPKLLVVKGNQFFTVLKNALSKRGCAKGPTLNVFGQLGIGSYVRSRLRKFGVYLRDQRWNQALAEMAIEWRLATIDLSQASDLLAKVVVRRLLPDKWVHLLETFREDATQVGKEWVALEKYCAMGNGFTFPLQSLIFWGVVRAIVPYKDLCVCAVYGDDIIVPQEYAIDVVEALEYLGFRVNSKKSHLAGAFFESCGTDWFNGQNVRPFYLRKEEVDELDAQAPFEVQTANALRLWSQRRLGGWGCDKRFKSVWERLFRESHADWKRCRIPDHLGDVGFITSFSEVQARRPVGSKDEPRDGWAGWEARTCCSTAVRSDKRTFGVALACLKGMTASDRGPSHATLYKEVELNRLILKYGPLQGDLLGVPASYGLEPRRGYLGKLVTRWTFVNRWSDGFRWF
jgi:hypothetical protein